MRVIRFVFLYFITMSAMAGPMTFYAYQSQAGDYIGEGKSGMLSDADGKITANGTRADLTLGASNEHERWHMLISAPQGASLTEQIYNHTTAWGSTVDPQLLVGVDQRGCSIAAGSFDVEDIKFVSGSIDSLAIDFMQHCNDSKDPLFGAIRYHSFVPNDLAQYILAHTTKTGIQLYSQSGDSIGEGRSYHFSKNDKDYNVNTNGYDNHLSIEYNPEGYWYFDFAASDKNPLKKGCYADASRYTRSATTNALYVHTHTRVCDVVKGRFDVLEFDAKEKRYAIDFEQQCNGAMSALYGAVRFHSNKPVSIIEKSNYSAMTQTLILPMVEIDQQYYTITLAAFQGSPTSFKIMSIARSSVRNDAIKVPEVFNVDKKRLTVPLIEAEDVFGHRYQLKDVLFKAQKEGLAVGDVIKCNGYSNVTI